MEGPDLGFEVFAETIPLTASGRTGAVMELKRGCISHALEVLDRLETLRTSQEGSRNERLTIFLKDPEAEYADGWFMCVPRCFNDSLDIRKTERVVKRQKQLSWTQGYVFSFSEGDILYDTAKAYESWTEALKEMKVCIQVQSGTAASKTFAGSVRFTTLVPDVQKKKLVKVKEETLTQEEFVRLLISGERMPSILEMDLPMIPAQEQPLAKTEILSIPEERKSRFLKDDVILVKSVFGWIDEEIHRARVNWCDQKELGYTLLDESGGNVIPVDEAVLIKYPRPGVVKFYKKQAPDHNL
jgi:hypothetical protein